MTDIASVLSGSARWCVIDGDSREVLRSLPDASCDSCVCDPPAGIAFMNREWDKDKGGRDAWIAWLRDIMREALRALKPGAHGFVWALPRTSHWTATALEDAGFQIRDIITHVFATGFPKSVNLSATIDRCLCECNSDMRDVWGGVSDLESLDPQGEASALFDAMQRRGTRRGVGEARSQVLCCADGSDSPIGDRQDDRAPQSVVEGRGNVQIAEGELRIGALHPLSSGPDDDGAKGRLRHGAPRDDGANGASDADAGRGGAPRRPRPAKQRSTEPGDVAGQSVAQDGGAWPLCGGCGKPMVPAGLGTALKPATEHWILIRKPIEKTIAANVLAHGTGGINVDGCRVAVSADDRVALEHAGGWARAGYESKGGTILGGGRSIRPAGQVVETDAGYGLGRWPPNLLLTHAPTCTDTGCEPACPVAEMDRQSGVTVSTIGTPRSSAIPGSGYGMTATGAEYADSGGASRFFPVFRFEPKASTAEREAGLDALPLRTAGELTGRVDGSAGLTPRAGAGSASNGRRNTHPTIKPIALMAWLCRLVTPPNGIVLDPFAGAGTCGCACVDERFRYVGIELEAAHVEIARYRIEHHTPRQRDLFRDASAARPAPAPEPKQPELFK